MFAMTTQIRDYKPGDFPEVEDFWQRKGLGGSHRGDTELILNNTLKAGGHLLLLCNVNGKIIGTSWLTNDKRRTYLHHFGIEENYRGQGLSKILLKASLERAAADGYQIKIEVHRDNHIALRLYENAGFKALGDYDVYMIRNLENLNR
jgi:ribosomal protein S18 acetylase RimI-like enzyme